MDFNPCREGYMQYLQRRRQEREEERRNAPKPKSLSEQITDWYESLPPAEQRAAYSMDFFVARFGATPQQVSKSLFAQNWRRFRRWETGKPHCRVWVRNYP